MLAQDRQKTAYVITLTIKEKEMKKIIIYYAGKWAENLLTIDRYKKVDYFIDEAAAAEGTVSFLGAGSEKPVFAPDILDNENPDDIVIIVSDNYGYNDAKKVLEGKGLTENVHFFNGWKLDPHFYKRYYSDSSWQENEESNSEIISQNWFDERSEIMASLIPEDTRSLMDIGCGVCFLRQHLPEHIKYYGLDYCERENVDFVCDMNNEPLPAVNVDMYYMAGLVYYIDDIERVISQMTGAKYILFDYGGIERYLRLDGVPEDPLVNARNNYASPEEIFNILRKYGFTYEKGYWNWKSGKIGWHIYLFKKIGC